MIDFTRARRLGALSLATLSLLVAAPAFAGASPVIVQGTTDVRDAGLLEDVLVPGFHAAYPEYELKYVPVGTGQAIANAKAGGGDALLVHAPSQEKTFVEEGYSLEARGRAVFYSDYVIPGPLKDPAGVLAGAPHNAALAFELIAKAGGEGKANFVSRGDNSGTNTQEKAIWKLTKVELNKLGEPGPAGTETDASWYHKAVAGQAETVKLTAECPESNFSGGGCYEMTDRGTYNRLIANGSVTTLQIVSQLNEAAAPGGSNLLTNPFSVYAVNPAKVGVSTNVDGAKALLAYLTSESFQTLLASYPNTNSPAFFADAHPTMTASPISGTLAAGTRYTVSGRLTNKLPGAQPVGGVQVNLQVASAGGGYSTVASAVTSADGTYTLGATASASSTLRVEMPTTDAYPSLLVTPLISSGALTQTFVAAGGFTVPGSSSSPASPGPSRPSPTPLRSGKLGLLKPSTKGRVVTLRGSLSPAVDTAGAAILVVQGRRLGQGKGKSTKFRVLKEVRARTGVAYKVAVKLKPGKWKLRVRYRDPGVITQATSRAVSVAISGR